MKKNRKGFTLIELLAVIVVLGLIMTIAGTAILRQKKDANKKEAVKIEQSIKDLGPNIYSYEYLTGIKDFKSYCENTGGTYDNTLNTCSKDGVNVSDKSNDYFYKSYKALTAPNSLWISLNELNEAGYIKKSSIENPGGKGTCAGYLEVKKVCTDGTTNYSTCETGPDFKAYIDCSGLYTSPGYTVISNSVELTNSN